MTGIRSSDHAEHNLHCPISGAAEECSAWTIHGSGPAYCRRPASAHAERSATLTLPYKGRESPQGDSVPLENPCNLERKQDGDADRSGPPWGRRPRRSPPWGDGAIASDPAPGSRTGPGCARRGLLGRGVCPTPVCLWRGYGFAGCLTEGYTLGYEQDTLAGPGSAAAAAAGHRHLRLDLHSVPSTDRPARDSAARPTEHRPRTARRTRRQRQPREPQTHTSRLQLGQARRTPAPPPSDGNRGRIFSSRPAGQPAPAKNLPPII